MTILYCMTCAFSVYVALLTVSPFMWAMAVLQGLFAITSALEQRQ